MPNRSVLNPLKPTDPACGSRSWSQMPLFVAVAGRCFTCRARPRTRIGECEANGLRQSDTYTLSPPGSQTSQPAPYVGGRIRGCIGVPRLTDDPIDRFGGGVETYGTEGRGSGSSAVRSARGRDPCTSPDRETGSWARPSPARVSPAASSRAACRGMAEGRCQGPNAPMPCTTPLWLRVRVVGRPAGRGRGLCPSGRRC